MGAWGAGLYSDDFALDVKSEFLDAINSGKPYREAFEELKKTYVDNAYNDDPDIPVFWFVCADILWKKGRLDEDIKQTALAYIESNSDVERWNLESSALGKKRKTGIALMYIEGTEKNSLLNSITKKLDKIKNIILRSELT